MERREKMILRPAGYAAFFLVFFVLMLYLLFPFNRWKGTLEELLSSQLERRVTIGSVSAWGVTGLKLHDVSIAPKSSGQDADDGAADGRRAPKKTRKKEEQEPPVEVERLGIRVSPLAAITGKMGICFDMRIFEGSIKGCYVDGARSPLGKRKQVTPGEDGPTTSIDVKVRGIDMNRIQKLESLVGLPFFGTAEADVDLEYVAGRPETVSGEVELVLDDLRIGEPGGKIDLAKAGKGALAGQITFEPIEVGDLEVFLVGKEGKLVVEQFESGSEHVRIRGAGNMLMREPILSSGLNIYVMFKFLPAYIDKSAMNKTIFSALDRVPQFRKAKRPDGYFGWLLKGDLRSGPKPLPSRSGPSTDKGLVGPGKKGVGTKKTGLPMGLGSQKKPRITGGKPAADQ